MEPNWNPYVKSISAGIAAAIVALIAGYSAGEGIAVVEWLTAILAFLAGAGLVQAAAVTTELYRVRAEQAETKALLNRTVVDHVMPLAIRMQTMETNQRNLARNQHQANIDKFQQDGS
jgi:hypothetical protein